MILQCDVAFRLRIDEVFLRDWFDCGAPPARIPWGEVGYFDVIWYLKFHGEDCKKDKEQNRRLIVPRGDTDELLILFF